MRIFRFGHRFCEIRLLLHYIWFISMENVVNKWWTTSWAKIFCTQTYIRTLTEWHARSSMTIAIEVFPQNNANTQNRMILLYAIGCVLMMRSKNCRELDNENFYQSIINTTTTACTPQSTSNQTCEVNFY